MQIVIYIDQSDYDFIREENESNYAITQRLYNAVAHGTPMNEYCIVCALMDKGDKDNANRD